MDQSTNHLHSIIEFFSVPGKPVTAKEVFDFWLDLTPDEKTYYKTMVAVYKTVTV